MVMEVQVKHFGVSGDDGYHEFNTDEGHPGHFCISAYQDGSFLE
jgi:hypothetical protein